MPSAHSQPGTQHDPNAPRGDAGPSQSSRDALGTHKRQGTDGRELALARTVAGPRDSGRSLPALLEAPATIGRYLVIEQIGSGGMGEVYAAYDRDLDRRIAIKLLHQARSDVDGRRRERLLREAQAMARVSHPNVVHIHEVGTAEEQVFLAMEYVSGPTMADWLANQTRSWQEIVDVIAQAAAGLAALHRAGLVHRDVKPSNIIVGDDGRVRVLDLGLVGVESNDDRPQGKQPQDLQESVREFGTSSLYKQTDLTRTGEYVGTPAYMSREQFLGIALTPATDVFSLSVVLYEGLSGAHPFMGDTFQKLRENVVIGRIKSTELASSIPPRLRALVLEGLSTQPNNRPTMEAFRQRLSDAPRPARRWWMLLSTLLAAALLATLLFSRVGVSSTCDGRQVSDEILTEDDVAAVRAAMVASELPYASELADRVINDLNVYAKSWAAHNATACQDYARGYHSATLLDARMVCLDRRREALAETVALLKSGGEDVVSNAGQMVGKLPRLSACDNLADVQGAAPPDPKLREPLQALEQKLLHATTLGHAGRLEAAQEAIFDVVQRAEAIGHEPTVVRALLTAARTSLNLQADRSSTRETLNRALALAIRAGLATETAEAMIRRVYVRGLHESGADVALADVPVAEAMLHAAGDPPELRALLLNNTGSIHLAAGDRRAAREAFKQSFVIKEHLYGADHLEIAVALANLGMLAVDDDSRKQLHGRMLEIYRKRLGPVHPQTLDARFLSALYTPDPAQTSRELDQLCQIFEELGDKALTSACTFEHGRIDSHRGNIEEAAARFRQAKLYTEEDSIEVDAYFALTNEPVVDPFIAQLTEHIGHLTANSWWEALHLAELRILRGRLHLKAGAGEKARDDLRKALMELSKIEGRSTPVEHERLVISAQQALLTALRQGDSDPREIAELRAKLATFYQRWPEAYRRRLQQLQNE